MKSAPAQIVTAIKEDDVRALQVLLQNNPEQLTWNTPFGGETWLGYAASMGKLNSMALLVELGADVNQGDHRENVKPICSAASRAQVESAEFLLNQGAVLDTQTSVQNPLFSAVVGRSPTIVKLLLKAGIDYSVRYNSETMSNMNAIAFSLLRGEKVCAHIIASWDAGNDEVKARSLLKQADEIANQNAGRKKS